MKFGTQQQIGESHVIKCEFFLKLKMADSRHISNRKIDRPNFQ